KGNAKSATRKLKRIDLRFRREYAIYGHCPVNRPRKPLRLCLQPGRVGPRLDRSRWISDILCPSRVFLRMGKPDDLLCGIRVRTAVQRVPNGFGSRAGPESISPNELNPRERF